MRKLFISHSPCDDGFVRELQRALKRFGVMAWTDWRELRPGDKLEPLIQKAIEAATGFAVVVSPAAFQSRWVDKELRHALEVRKTRGEGYPVIPLLLDGAGPGLLAGYFADAPGEICVTGDESGVDKAAGQILTAMGLRSPAHRVPEQAPPAEPVEELVPRQANPDGPLLAGKTAAPTGEDALATLKRRMGKLPRAPKSGFVGRSGELSALQRLLQSERYAVIHGQDGEGKTALAAELGRAMVRSRQVQRAAFVAIEGVHENVVESVLDRLGQQLVEPEWPPHVDGEGDEAKAEMAIARALTEQPTLLVVDNLEGILPAPYVRQPAIIAEEAQAELAELLGLCERLNGKGETRILFTSCAPLPAPFDGELQRHELGPLSRDDAVALMGSALGEGKSGAGAAADAGADAMQSLVDAAGCHARTLLLLVSSLRTRGVTVTRASLAALMEELQQRFPDSREQSCFASVELSLRRMSPTNRDRARVLAVFHGGVSLYVLRKMMGWSLHELDALAGELVVTGLAKRNPYKHLTFDPALCPYLWAGMEQDERAALQTRWVEAMRDYVEFLCQQQTQHTEVARKLSLLELPNLFTMLELVRQTGSAEAAISLTTLLLSLMKPLGKSRLLERVAQARANAVNALSDPWTHEHFEAQRSRIAQQLDGGQPREALAGAKELLQRARMAGERAYPASDYDLAMAVNLVGQTLVAASSAAQALHLFDEARRRFELIAQQSAGHPAERMATLCLARRGDCLRTLGRLDDAAAAYAESIRESERLADEQQVAALICQLATVRLAQGRFEDALAACEHARDRYARLGESGAIATTWHETGNIYAAAGHPTQAEDAYRAALAVWVRVGDIAGQAATLSKLGRLLDDALARTEEAVTLLNQAADKYVEIKDLANEATARNDTADCLRRLHLLHDARQQVHRAIECKAQLGPAALPWTSWSILAGIEADSGNPVAAAQARRKATDSYLAYRRNGGENPDAAGRLVLAASQRLAASGPAAASAFLQQVAADPNVTATFRTFIRTLQAILDGGRDRGLADAPELDYGMAAEILLLIETLERRGRDG